MMKWISVKDRLPEAWTWVLICLSAEISIAYYIPDGFWKIEYNENTLPAKRATHWMPLPEPPTSDESEASNE